MLICRAVGGVVDNADGTGKNVLFCPAIVAAFFYTFLQV